MNWQGNEAQEHRKVHGPFESTTTPVWSGRVIVRLAVSGSTVMEMLNASTTLNEGKDKTQTTHVFKNTHNISHTKKAHQSSETGRQG